jgi:RNA exonuclease 4
LCSFHPGEDFDVVQAEVSAILRGRRLVGHALAPDLRVLCVKHPREDIRDTATFEPFRKAMGARMPSLRKITRHMLGVNVLVRAAS